MATLQKIRNKGPLLAIVVGLALAAFILGDMLNSGRSIFGGNQFEIAKVGGESVSYQEYQSVINQREAFYQNIMRSTSLNPELIQQIRNYAWEKLIRNYTIGKELNDLGINASSDELYDMVKSGNVTPMIRQLFTNPNTGQFDPNVVFQFINNMDSDPSGQSKAVWLYLEEELKESRVFVKYNNLINKALYITSNEVEKNFVERTKMVDIKFVSQSYESISDSAVSISASEIKSFYDENIARYTQEEARDIDYITFDVIPTKEDTLLAEDAINKLADDFKVSEDPKQFVNLNSDVSFDPIYYKKGDFLNPEVDSLMFSSDMNTVYGPYIEDGSYKMIRLIERKPLPDSVKVKHILIQPNGQDIADVDRAKEIADSLIQEINNGVDFGALATEYSADQGSAADSGNLGWVTQETNFVEPFKKACFENKIGELTTVESEYGVHIVNVLEQTQEITKVQAAILEFEIQPSQTTYQDIYAKASEFQGLNNNAEKFNKAVKENNLVKRVAPNLTAATQVIPGLPNSRELIRWSFNAEKGQVSEVHEFGDRYVVALLVSVKEKGYAPVELVSDIIKEEIIKDKKAEIILNQIESKDLSKLETLAADLNTTVKEAKNINFTTFQIVGAGYEPAVIAKAVTMEKDQVSKPIKGKNGVYVFKVTSLTPAQDPKANDLTADKNQLLNTLQSRASYQAYDALKKNANIIDKRAKFF